MFEKYKKIPWAPIAKGEEKEIPLAPFYYGGRERNLLV